jgi:hypothetical protein
MEPRTLSAPALPTLTMDELQQVAGGHTAPANLMFFPMTPTGPLKPARGWENVSYLPVAPGKPHKGDPRWPKNWRPLIGIR